MSRFRLGSKYAHLVTGGPCPCHSPALQKVAGRLESFSRRGFLIGGGAAMLSAALPTMGKAQDRPSARIVLRNLRLFDGTADTLADGVQVVVEGNRIAALDTTNATPPDDARVIDCGGRVLMPGLIDAHWHTLYAAVPLPVLMTAEPGMIFAASTAEAERTLMRGFTTVRDMGGPVFSFKQAIDSGIIVGPRIFPSGAMITTSGGHADLRMPFEIPRDGALSVSELMGTAAIVDDAGDLKRRVREQLLQGASQIKLVGGGGVSSPRSPLDMSTFDEDELRAAVAVARDWNTYVSVHAYAPETVRRSLMTGVGCVEHAHLMDEETARLFAEREVWLSTQPFLTMDDAASQTGPGVERVRQLFEGTPRVYEYARRYGIRTAWGSDVLFSPELAPRQNIMLTHLGRWYSNAEVLRSATSVNAELLAMSGPRTPYDGRLGVIQAGALADMILIDGNPLDDLSLLENPSERLSLIVKDGVIVKTMLE
ncbi:amidohydrolase family protein [Aureimonas altamirensis]|uniref:metal-dependent hydrolase family protein n=1 Tax=Aureimonas altamirensis TaxID=370622 RepID=UPI002036D0D4|nr:amidohydrolase family protein [Aureimonas altamirensis]MCM2502069.1 amidohydrolase family protein [Aureimonas altamirensis]